MDISSVVQASLTRPTSKTNEVVAASRQHVATLMLREIERAQDEDGETAHEVAFYVADMGEVYRQFQRWKSTLPWIRPFYFKSNPNKEVLRLLAKLGAGFDCASKAEIETVLQLGVPPQDIIYAHPCKIASHLDFARSQGVSLMTFDSVPELEKIKKHFPDAKLLLRIVTHDATSRWRLSTKFGANVRSASSILNTARDLGLSVVGISFHIGSAASDPEIFNTAIQDTRAIFDLATTLDMQMSIIDVGGGFQSHLFDLFAASLNTCLRDYFPTAVTVIAEPGRYMVSTAFALAVSVIGHRDPEISSGGPSKRMLYLSDGVYGNFSNTVFDRYAPEPRILVMKASTSEDTSYSIWGPTCDVVDTIIDDCRLLKGIQTGDWLLFHDMGAYTMSSTTCFNGIDPRHRVIYISSEARASVLLDYR